MLRRNELSIYAQEYKDPDPSKENYEGTSFLSDCLVDDVTINNEVIARHFKSYKEDEDTQPAVGNEFGDSDNTPTNLMSSKHLKFSHPKRGDNSVESNLRRARTHKLDSQNLQEKGKKGSSIPRRNLFKKKVKDSSDSGKKSPFNSNMKRVGYKSLLEKERKSQEGGIAPNPNKMSFLTERYSKDKEGK